MIERLRRFFTEGHERSMRAKKNIAVSFIIRGASIGIGLVLVPLVLQMISPAEYGVWLTISSFIGWFSFFDIGLGNGLRNKFAEALAAGDTLRARQYVSTTYAIMIVIIGGISLLFFAADRWVEWWKVFNTGPGIAGQVAVLVPVVFGMFALQFVLQLVSTVLLADQRPAVNNLLGFLGSVVTLTGLFLLSHFSTPTLLQVGMVFTGAPLAVLLVAHIILYRTRYKEFAPSFRWVELRYAGELANLGVQFFIIQIAVLVLFTTSNMIITQYLGPAEVTSYNIALKYFGILNSVFILIATPMWSAITDAYHRNDTAWIHHAMGKLMRVWVLFAAAAGVMLVAAGPAYRLWVGDSVQVPFGVSLALSIFVTLTNWSSMFATFLNGTGKIRLQIYSAVLVTLVNIPLSIYCIGLFGLPGVIIASIICVSIGSVWAPIQYRKLITNTATGLWAK